MPEWFAPKTYGMGSGLPIAWQGWAVLVIYLAIFFGSFLLLGQDNAAAIAIAIIATALLLFITAKTTKGGWRWRWGKGE